MPIRKTEGFINGYITVRIKGLHPEKFINAASAMGIRIWDIKRVDYTTLEVKMDYKNYINIRPVLLKSGCRSKIIGRKGLHFLIGKARRRIFFTLGVVAFSVFLFYMSRFIWFVDVVGSDKIDHKVVLETAEKAGLKSGVNKDKVSLRRVENEILIKIDEVSVVNIKLRGTRAIINIVERNMPPKIVDKKEPSDIVASKDGIIESILCYQGDKQVQVGDYVKKGQVLISGITVDKENTPIGAVHAMGIVSARTWYESFGEAKFNYTEQVRTGREKKDTYMLMGQNKICIKKSNIDFEKYDKIEEKINAKIGGIVTPVKMLVYHYYEVEDRQKVITPAEAFSIASEEAEKKASSFLPKGIPVASRKLEKFETDDMIRVRVLYTYIENIGVDKGMK